MAQPTYSTRAVVLRKTRLGEADLIVTLLAQDGSQLRAVAKGARKPRSSFASRLELYSVVDLLCARGKSLDIVKEARIASSNQALRDDIERTTCAAPMAELLDRVTQGGLSSPRLFDMTCTAFRALGSANGPRAVALCDAHLLKTFAFVGLCPSLRACVACGHEVGNDSGRRWFSFNEGGVVCEGCRAQAEAVSLAVSTIAWADVYLRSTFADLTEMSLDEQAPFEVLDLCRQWSRAHVGTNLKSIDFLLTSGVF